MFKLCITENGINFQDLKYYLYFAHQYILAARLSSSGS